jgi:hypothetical protein
LDKNLIILERSKRSDTATVWFAYKMKTAFQKTDGVNEEPAFTPAVESACFFSPEPQP